MDRFSGFLKGSSKNVLTLFTGVALAQVIALATSPLLSRVFSPEDFGVFAFFQSVAAVLIVIVTGRYELAILLPESDEDAWSIAQLSFALSVGLTFSIFLLLELFGKYLLSLIDKIEFLQWLLWLPLFVISSAIFNIFIFWNNRKDFYKNISKSKVLQVIGVSFVSLICGFLNFGPLGLIIGIVFGQFISILFLVDFTEKKYAKFSIYKIKKLASIYKKFPLINLPHAFLDALHLIALLGLIGFCFGAEVVGLYAFSMRIVRTPLSMLGSSIGSVFQSLAAKKYNQKENFSQLLKSTVSKSLLISAPLSLIILSAPWLFEFVFGDKWLLAGELVQILGPWLVLSFIVSPFSQIPLIVGQQGKALFFGILYQISMLSPFIGTLVFHWELKTTFVIQSLSASFALLIYAFWLYKLTNVQDDR